MVVRVEEGLLGRRDALLLGIVFSAATPPLLAPAGALADEATAGTAAPTLSVLVVLCPCLLVFPVCIPAYALADESTFI